MLTYAIGDVHGSLELLVDLLTKVEAHAGDRPRRLVFIGDYIDRGRDSAGVISMLRDLQEEPGADVVCLMGNHEDLLVRALDDPDMNANWIYNGGDTTLASFRVTEADALPPDVLVWIRALPTAFEDERRCFVHAGLNPDYDRASQSDHDRLWIREPFLSVDHDFGKFVVHGHTPQPSGQPDLRPFRVNLDTGAVYGGRLTAGIFTDAADAPVGFLQSPSS